ncbi:MAG: bifunctional anthranilate synthase component II/anthranilate phosphoribosyltransferase [Bacteroides sp.]|nr:bifunctional anthranilate synthase component II/anthranilate phosphoribosyltransferase [Prevotella sp.]MCM1408503.1 bifunctional anthranilate synthase component II/anthranilate phosphoribosyltransferase [Treponema brennaborense]MCM1469336.1 bifunctional anthranilate synthase component II/anthranilate phosphoribosyltransferase [Bacteroides sp.]
MILVIDNYDSFTYNVVQSLAKSTQEEIRVVRSRETTIDELQAMNPTRLIISPGPGRPEDAGVSVEAVRCFAGKIPILGVCLGHQAIGSAFGARIVQAKYIKHGIAEKIALDGRGLFRTVGNSGTFTRYHSLVVDEQTLPPEFEVTARAEDGDIMGIRHKTMIIEGVQFHPESIASESAEKFFAAFLNYRREPFAVTAALNRLCRGENLDRATAELFMEDLTDGCLDERHTAAILTALAVKKPAAEEIAGCAAVLCRKKTPLPVSGAELTDIVGTGGDGKGSFNISSLAALTAASCGLPVAKHGNRAVSSKSGAADFYEALGVQIELSPEKSAELVRQTNFCFLYAPLYHSAMRYAGPVRKALGIKTIMNLIGPLSNPAGAAYQMLGVYDASLLKPVARASKMLGSKRVMVVASEDGFDEISPCAPTDVFEIDENGNEKEYRITPQDFGIANCAAEELAGGTNVQNAELARALLDGKGSDALKYAVALNAGAALYIGGKSSSIRDGFKAALAALADGTAAAELEKIRTCSHAA